ncbi:GntR family transcriptional regulator/MocR family aminotransferase [Algoriphagus sp. 4150]|uniref:MocR-like pyridoxine biosynthesis transcription factor PdxR n=1 Tax=Algoriphagus sp. 4150 TaxID=2817756 RepID=UPI002862CA36|nr:PLP-dependent aminotransferase family protein [Algoriphagus sp. 4150]MDR7130197.1 GntR family transcriptional regulator/MocR family aminotransferase [Algoriphagus sp. 4150]
MNSPVEIPYKSLIQIDRLPGEFVYIQIANQLIQAIQYGSLPPGTKLPGTRALCALLNVHRNTVSAVYEELFAQGWVEVKPNKGTFVISQLPTVIRQPDLIKPYPSSTRFDFKISNLLDSPFEQVYSDYIFNDGTPDIRLTQIEDLSRFYSANMKRKSNQNKMSYHNQEGSRYFKEQLTHYLNLSRGLSISVDNLLITRSNEMSLYIISEIILQANDYVVVGSLSYFSANMIFQKNNAHIVTVPVDEGGLNTTALRNLCERHPIRMVYVTPHHHYPTTVSLKAQRRMALLQLAMEFGFVIVEDDHDYDFHYNKQPLLPLATADTEGLVIYVGSFGKSLAPGFRTGFIVAPENLMREMRKHLGVIDRQGDVLMEQALGEMIEEGVIRRHLKRSLKIYRERRNFMADLLKNELGEHVQFQQPSGGLAFWVVFNKAVNLMQLKLQCEKNNLFIPKTLLYQNRNLTAMRIGFGHLNEEEMLKSIAILKQSIESVGAITGN